MVTVMTMKEMGPNGIKAEVELMMMKTWSNEDGRE